jgi:hypothetical protein
LDTKNQFLKVEFLEIRFSLCRIFKNSKNCHGDSFKVPTASDSSLVFFENLLQPGTASLYGFNKSKVELHASMITPTPQENLIIGDQMSDKALKTYSASTGSV